MCLPSDDETECDPKTETGEGCERIGDPTPGWVAGPRPRHLCAWYYGLFAGGNDLSDARHGTILISRNESKRCMGCVLTVRTSLPAVIMIRLCVGPYGPMKPGPASAARHDTFLHVPGGTEGKKAECGRPPPFWEMERRDCADRSTYLDAMEVFSAKAGSVSRSKPVSALR